MFSLQSIKTSQVVNIPGWCGDVVEVELKRPSILALAAAGAIPNPLMKTARKLFYSGVLEEAGIELTDEQLVAIFQFTQLGAKALDRFRQLPADNDGDIHGAEVSE